MTADLPILQTLTPADVRRQRPEPVNAEALATAAEIINDVRVRGDDALRHHSERLGDLTPGQPMLFSRAQLAAALDRTDRPTRKTLEEAAKRIRSFADAQRACLKELDAPVAGGRAGHWIAPMQRAGCYAPGGRFPLPSSVLMTVCTARAAGVGQVIVASPRPAPVTLAAAAIAGADSLLVAGGAQAVAALAYGTAQVPACDIIVGPGNRYVTAAKKLVAGTVAIDMLAGPSEVLIIADDSASAAVIAADLLAQAEHDADARAILVTTCRELISGVNAELVRQLSDLPTAPTARQALAESYAVLCPDLDAAVVVADAHAPEHLEVQTRDSHAVARRCAHFGAVFIGAGSAEVFGDYGLGPNHVLPTGGTARAAAGLSVFTFLRVRTFLAMDVQGVPASIADDLAAFARLEGLEAHARASLARRTAP